MRERFNIWQGAQLRRRERGSGGRERGLEHGSGHSHSERGLESGPWGGEV
jgi:hypothetical protein